MKLIKGFQQQSFWLKFLIIFGTPIILVILLSMKFDNDPVADPNAFLDNLSQLLGAVLGIVFTISTIAITIASDRYTSQIFSRYISDKKAWAALAWILFVIIVATIAIGLNDPMTEMYYWIMVLFFVWSIEALVYYVWHTMDSLRPESLAQSTLDQGVQALEKFAQLSVGEQENTESPEYKTLREMAAILAGLTIKAVEQRDETLAEKYLTAMGTLQEKWATLTIEPPDTIFNFWETFSKRYESPIIDEYERVFKLVYAQISENLKIVFLSLLRGSIDQLILSDNNARKLGTILRQYKSVFKFMLTQGGKDEDVRFLFFLALRDTINHYQNQYIPTCANAVSDLLQVIIDLDDQELWDKGLDFFTTGSLSLATLQDYLATDLSQLINHIPHDQHYGYWFHLRNLISYSLESKWTSDNSRVFDAGLARILNALPDTILSNPYHTQTVYRHIRSLEVSTRLIDSLYVMCLNLFARGEYSYIVKLWQFKGANHNDIRWLPPDVGFLTIQIMQYQSLAFGLINGRNLEFSQEIYMHQYYFLCLAYILWKGNQEYTIYPNLPSEIIASELGGDTDLSKGLIDALRSKYILLQNLPHVLSQVLEQYDHITSLVNNQVLNQAFEGNYLQAVEQAKQWLQSSQLNEGIERSCRGIVQVFPLAEDEISIYRQSFEDEYQKLEIRFDLLNVEAHRSANSKTLFSNTEHLSRNVFTALASQTGINDRALQVTGLISSLYGYEHSHIATEITRHQSIRPIHADQLEWNMVIDASKNLLNQYYSEYLILMLPLDQIFHFERAIPGFSRETDEVGREIIEIQTESYTHPIKLIVIRMYSTQTNTFLFSPASIQWTTLELPTIVLSNCPRNETMIHLSANGVFACEIVMPQGITWFEFTLSQTLVEGLPQLGG